MTMEQSDTVSRPGDDGGYVGEFGRGDEARLHDADASASEGEGKVGARVCPEGGGDLVGAGEPPDGRPVAIGGHGRRASVHPVSGE